MKPKGNEDELRMPAADFDRIMGKVMGPENQRVNAPGALTLERRAKVMSECSSLSELNDETEEFENGRGVLVGQLMEWGQSEEQANLEIDRFIRQARANRASR